MFQEREQLVLDAPLNLGDSTGIERPDLGSKLSKPRRRPRWNRTRRCSL
jgi:hypothetical protein